MRCTIAVETKNKPCLFYTEKLLLEYTSRISQDSCFVFILRNFQDEDKSQEFLDFFSF